MNQSQTIGNLAGALAKAQAKIRGAVKDSANPFFKSSYADLQSVWDACREPLTANGLAVIQTTDETTQGTQLVTTLAHESGEFITGRMPILPLKNEPQALGSAISYARRYALAAIVGVYQTDDDAETAQARRPVAQAATTVAPVSKINEVVRAQAEIGKTIDAALSKAQADVGPGAAMLARRKAEQDTSYKFPDGPFKGRAVSDLDARELSEYGLTLEGKLHDKGLTIETAPAPIKTALTAISAEAARRAQSAQNASNKNQKG